MFDSTAMLHVYTLLNSCEIQFVY